MRAWLLPVVIGLLSGCAGRHAETPAVPPTAKQTVERAAPEPGPVASTLQMGLSASLERTLVEAGQPTRLWMRVRIEAPVLPAAPRPPANVALVLDTSGSMAGEPVEDLEAITSSRDPELATAAAEIEAADVTVRAVGLARAGQLDEAHHLVDIMIEQLEDDIEAFDAAPLRTALEGLVQLRPTLVTAVPDAAALQRHKASLPAAGSGLGSIELRSSGLREYGRALRTLGM